MLAAAPFVFTTGVVLADHDSKGELASVTITCAVLAVGGVASWRTPQVFPGYFWFGVPFVAVAVITGLNVLTNDASTGAQLFYLWPVLYAAMYLVRWALYTVLVVVFTGEATTVFLVFADPDRAWYDWTGMILALSMSSVVVMTLRERADRLLEVLETEALADPLTGLPNRRSFDRELAHTEHWLRRSGGPLAILSVDIDRFKAVNDTWGHAGGDRALQAVATAMRAATSPIDVVARLGGDEFVMLLRADRHRALQVAADLRESLTAAVDVPGGPPSLSIGVAVLPDDADTVTTLLAASDAALYDAKASGRGRVASAGAAPPDDSTIDGRASQARHLPGP